MLLLLLAMLAVPQVKAPTLTNRTEIIKERERLSRLLIAPHDTVTVWVFVDINPKGHATRIESPQDDVKPNIKQAALDLVAKMRWKAGTQNGKPVKIINKIPVKFARP